MFKAVNIDFEQSVRESFERQSFMKTLGAELKLVGPGEVEIFYKHRDDLLQQHGFLHAGVATAIVDSACGYAAMTLLPKGGEVMTAEFKVNFLRPAKGEQFFAIGRVLKPGTTLSVCEGEVWSGYKEKLIAKMQMTMAIQL